MRKLLAAARDGSLVILAGAGVSAGPPSSLPGWLPLNAAIFRALRLRLEAGLDHPGWLERTERELEALRQANRLPPDYQAQVIEEMCGERYFRGLQALDVDVTSAAHDGIAGLAAAGAVRAILTTNFDRLIERSLARLGVAHEAFSDTAGYERLRDRCRSGIDGPLPVIKIHGSVSDPLSMIDTLKQRRRGRSRAIEECLAPLHAGYWLYLGFSAADLEADPGYLDLVTNAAHSAGATFVSYPGNPALGPGAQLLMDAYGTSGTHEVADSGAFLREIRRGLSLPDLPEPPASAQSGRSQFEQQLATWASTLSLAATGLCLAAVAEAAGRSEPAARILDRLARKEIYEERDTPDFRALQLQYGRLGAAFGRFVNVPDLNGMASNASVEAVQSLLRLQGTDQAVRALGWMPCLYLWLNDGNSATSLAAGIVRGFAGEGWPLGEPQTDEDAVDAWLAAALVLMLNTHLQTYGAVDQTFALALDRARRSGDVVRTARVVALELMIKAESSEDLRAIAQSHQALLADVQRVGDGFAEGFWALALGRWHTGPGGQALARQAGSLEPVAGQALRHVDEAIAHFQAQGMDPWCVFAQIQRANALFDLRDEAVDQVFERIHAALGRFEILGSHVLEVTGQMRLATGNSQGRANLREAIARAHASGLELRHRLLKERYADLVGDDAEG